MSANLARRQFSTFFVNDQFFGIEVSQVQEVTPALAITPIYLAPAHVVGLINLRGQIATAIGLSQLFGFSHNGETKMSVVSRTDGTLLSLLVDRIGDVIEVSEDLAEVAPPTIPQGVRQFMSGVYKLPDAILSVIDMNKLNQFLIK